MTMERPRNCWFLGVIIIMGLVFEVNCIPLEPKAAAVIQGVPARKFKFFTSIFRNNEFRCGATLISPSLVLTAEHCVSDSTADMLKVAVADYIRTETESGEKRVNVRKIHIHPSYDIAILELTCAIDLNDNRFESITVSTQPLPVGTPVLVVGFGWTKSQSPSLSDELQELILPVADPTTCSAELQYYAGTPVRSHEFCGGFPTGDYVNVCHGDSGGPVLYDVPGGTGSSRYKLMGVIVRGPRYCPSSAHYAVFIDASSDFVQQFIQERLQSITETPLCGEPSTPKSQNTGCFTSDSLVQVDTGATKRIDNVTPGDRLLSRTPEGTLVYSEVMMNLHADPNIITEYLIIQTVSKEIKLTPNHLILVQDPTESNPVYRFAKNVKLGDFLFTMSGDVTVKDEAKAIRKDIFQGAYAPLTVEGTVVVNDVVASCYAQLESHEVSHLVFTPARFVHTWLPGSLNWWKSETESDIHWYPNLVRAVTGPALGLAGIHV